MNAESLTQKFAALAQQCDTNAFPVLIIASLGDTVGESSFHISAPRCPAHHGDEFGRAMVRTILSAAIASLDAAPPAGTT